jgi:hypothetical protein
MGSGVRVTYAAPAICLKIKRKSGWQAISSPLSFWPTNPY